MDGSTLGMASVALLSILEVFMFGSFAQALGAVHEFIVPTQNASPYGIAVGPDEGLWFTESGSGKVGRVSVSGDFSEYGLLHVGVPMGISAGSDGAMWFTAPGATADYIGRVSLAGSVTEFQLPDQSGPMGITQGADGALWFAEVTGNRIGRISVSGDISEFPLPTEFAYPEWTALGPDGNIWFTEAHQIGKISPDGTITEFPVPAQATPYFITAGPDGNLWFSAGRETGRITPSGVLKFFPVESTEGIAFAEDGSLWVADGASLRRIWEGESNLFGTPTGTRIHQLTLGPDGNIWFTDSGNAIGVVATGPPPNLVLTPNSGPPGTVVTVDGSGFSSDYIRLTFLDTTNHEHTLLSLKQDKPDGTFSVTVTIPADAAPGVDLVSAVGVYSKLKTRAQFTVTQ